MGNVRPVSVTNAKFGTRWAPNHDAKVVRPERHVVSRIAGAAIPRDLFADILRRSDRLIPASL